METNYIIFYQILAILTFNCYCEVLRQLRGLKSLNGDLASGSDDLSLKIWKRTNENFEMDRPTGGILSQVILKNGNLAEGMQEDKKEIIYISDTVTNEKIISLKGHSGSIWCLAVLKNGDLASGSQDKTIKIWDTNSGKLKNTLTGHYGPVTSLAVLNNDFLASGSADTTIKFWNPIEKKEKFTLSDHSGRILCLAVLQNGYLAAGYNDSLIIIWNPNYIKFNNSKLNKHLSKTLSGHSNKVYSLALLKNGDLASGSGDKTIKIWSTNNFKLIKTLTGHSDKILCLAVLKNGDLASSSINRELKIWNPYSGNVIITIPDIVKDIFSLVVTNNGDLVTGCNDGFYYVFNMSYISKTIKEQEKIIFKESERIQEGDKCVFTGFRTNQDDCQGYFYCKNNKVTKKQCTDKKLFDEKSKTCKELKDVFCGNRSLSNEEKGEKDQKNLCSSRPDGYYPNIENDCVDFFKCENLKTVNRSNCSNGLKFNNITLKCDHTSNIPAPCGTKFISNHYLHKTEFKFNILFGLITFIYFFISLGLITNLIVLSCLN